MGGKSGDGEAKKARKEEKERQARVRQGTARVGQIFGDQFTPEYFQQQGQNYINYATPQLTEQHQDAQKQLTYALARSGNMDSSARAELEGKLGQLYGINRQKVADDALSYGNKARSGVEDARTNLITMLNATGDAEGAANDAIRRATVLSQPATYSPLGQLFSDFTASLGQQAAQARAYELSGGAVGARGSGLFSPRRGAVVNT